MKAKGDDIMQMYSWREGSHISADPHVIGRALETLAIRQRRPLHGLTADDVVQEAMNEESPLHDLFEWDNDKAAHDHRCSQARSILNGLRVTVISNGEPRTVVGYVNVKPREDQPPMYIKSTFAARHEKLRAQMLNDARTGLNGWMKRYRELQGLDEVVALIGTAIERIDQEIEAAKIEEEAVVAG